MRMATPLWIEPIVGDWYSSHGQLFEVIAYDEADDILEIQHADGDLEEMEMDDWNTRCRAGAVAEAEPPEDPRLAIDGEEATHYGMAPSAMDEFRGLRADAIQDLDL